VRRFKIFKLARHFESNQDVRFESNLEASQVPILRFLGCPLISSCCCSLQTSDARPIDVSDSLTVVSSLEENLVCEDDISGSVQQQQQQQRGDAHSEPVHHSADGVQGEDVNLVY